jgi:hypothetical protein
MNTRGSGADENPPNRFERMRVDERVWVDDEA